MTLVWCDGIEVCNITRASRTVARHRAFLSIPAAIEFMRPHEWDRVHAECHVLAREFRNRVTELTGLSPLSPDSPEWYMQMVAVPLPNCDVDALKKRLYDEHRIEAPIFMWNRTPLMRASFQAYNTRGDVDRVVDALANLLRLVGR